MSRWGRSLAALVFAALLAALGACASAPAPKVQGSVVLLPDPGGKATAVMVKQGEAELLLDQPYSAAQLTSMGPRAITNCACTCAALAARPLPPTQFTLYFVEGKDEFTADSLRALSGVVTEIAKRPVPDVLVIGHTDAVGNDTINDTLSRQRAEVGRRALIGRGVAADNIVAIGRGKRELAVPTGDGVAEGRNRRIEIQVR